MTNIERKKTADKSKQAIYHKQLSHKTVLYISDNHSTKIVVQKHHCKMTTETLCYLQKITHPEKSSILLLSFLSFASQLSNPLYKN